MPRHVDLRPFAVNDGEDGVRAARRPHPGGAARRAAWSSTPARAAAPRTPGCSRPRRASDADRELGRRGLGDGHPPRARRRRARSRSSRWANSSSNSSSAGERSMLARNAESLYWIGRYVERPTTPRASSTSRCTSCWRTPPSTPTRATPDPARRARRRRRRRATRWTPGRSPSSSATRPTSPRSIVSSVSQRPGERPRRPRGRLRRDVGVPQRHLERPARAAALRPVGGAARVLHLRRGPRRDAQRAGRLHDEPRRHLAVPTCSDGRWSGST